MEESPIKLLLVEDNPGDARLVAEMLKEGGVACSLTHVSTLGAAIDHLSTHQDTELILLDLSLPDQTGLETLRRTLATPHSAVVVVMTGLGDD